MGHDGAVSCQNSCRQVGMGSMPTRLFVQGRLQQFCPRRHTPNLCHMA